MYEDVCRLCMSYGNDDIFKESLDTSVLYLKINQCLDIKIYPGDGLPTNICLLCEKQVNDFFAFKEKCTKVDVELRFHKETQKIHPKNDTKPIIKIEFKNVDCFNEDYTEDNYKKSPKSSPKNKELALKRKLKKFVQCEFCGQIFSKQCQMKQHIIAKHTLEKPYSCDICNQTFTRRDSQIVHNRIHANERPFVCNTCGRSSRKKQDLVRHMRVHSDKKDYKCSLCDHRFKRSQDVKSHMRSHTGDKPFKCHRCEKCYSSHSSLQKHLNTVVCTTR